MSALTERARALLSGDPHPFYAARLNQRFAPSFVCDPMAAICRSSVVVVR